ncbi:MAG: large subunit ribosomal protein L9 [Parcubacteria group bacterium Greene0416_79]|nr:MAG: large subunit ribosomal protein L9 [Parcubacteria group bacterium Greene0416_79]
MKIVLLQDIAGIGKKHDVKNVADGYAQNFLIPRNMAMLGTPEACARADCARAKEETEQKIQNELLRKNLDSLAGVVVEISGKASSKGHLFSGIHREAIALELKKQKGLDIPSRFLEVPHPIKTVGEHDISVSADGKAGTFKVIVKEA